MKEYRIKIMHFITGNAGGLRSKDEKTLTFTASNLTDAIIDALKAFPATDKTFTTIVEAKENK